MGSREKNVLLLLQDRTEDYKNKIALGIRTAFGWKEFTYKGIGLLSRKLGAFLINDFKITKGDRIAILSESKPEYGSALKSAAAPYGGLQPWRRRGRRGAEYGHQRRAGI